MRYVYKDCATNIIGTSPQIFELQSLLAVLRLGMGTLPVPLQRLIGLDPHDVVLT